MQLADIFSAVFMIAALIIVLGKWKGIRMRRKLLLTYGALILLTLLVCGTIFWSQTYGYMDEHNEDYYLTQAQLIRDLYDESEMEEKEFASYFAEKYDIRITLINEEGDVLADSAVEGELEKHNSREEVRAALRGKTYSVSRYSETMGIDYLYSAVPLEDREAGGVLRTSVPMDDLRVIDRNMFVSLGISLLVACAAALFIGDLFSRYITNPIDDITRVAEEISGGNYGGKIYTRQGDQIGRLATAFNKMSLDLKKTVGSLTNRNTELEAILGSMTNAVVAIDETNKILFSNEAFRKMFEIEDKKLKGRSIYSYVRNSIVLNSIARVRRRSESFMEEGNLVISDEKIIRIIATPLDEKEYKTFGVLLVITDITELKKLENMRSDFVSNVTHELKTPLTSIRGFVDTLKNGAINDEKVAKKFLDIIDLETERLSSLIQDILLLSEIENKEEYETVACDVPRVIMEVVELLSGKTGENVELQYEVSPEVTPYEGDPDRLKQLLINLTDNAIKSTESGYVTIKAEKEHETLVLRVQDTGIGIPEDALDRIFERFYRVDKGRSRKQGGTGLGLSIVKHIIELYDGTVQVHSTVGEGTEFEVRLPY